MTIFWKHAIVNRRVLKHFQDWWSRCPPWKCEGVIQNIAWLIQENENSSMSWPHSIRVCETGHGIPTMFNNRWYPYQLMVVSLAAPLRWCNVYAIRYTDDAIVADFIGCYRKTVRNLAISVHRKWSCCWYDWLLP